MTADIAKYDKKLVKESAVKFHLVSVKDTIVGCSVPNFTLLRFWTELIEVNLRPINWGTEKIDCGRSLLKKISSWLWKTVPDLVHWSLATLFCPCSCKECENHIGNRCYKTLLECRSEHFWLESGRLFPLPLLQWTFNGHVPFSPNFKRPFRSDRVYNCSNQGRKCRPGLHSWLLQWKSMESDLCRASEYTRLLFTSRMSFNCWSWFLGLMNRAIFMGDLCFQN